MVTYHVTFSEHATLATSVALCVNVLTFVVLPLPCWPKELSPHPNSLPSVVTYQVVLSEHATLATSVALCVNAVTFLVSPLPC